MTWQAASRYFFQRAEASSSASLASTQPPSDPSDAMLLFPERGARLQIVHQEIRRLESGAAVLRRRDHKHDVFARPDLAVAVDCGEAGQRPAPDCLRGYPHDLGFRHAWIVLELQRGQRAFLVPADARKGHHRADVAGLAHPIDLGRDVEIGCLYADDRTTHHVAAHGSAARHRREERDLARRRRSSRRGRRARDRWRRG